MDKLGQEQEIQQVLDTKDYSKVQLLPADALVLLRASGHDDKNLHTRDSGLIKVSLPDGKIENLISSRRIPPQTPLDGKPIGVPTGLRMTKSGLSLFTFSVMTNQRSYYATPIDKNDWHPISKEDYYAIDAGNESTANHPAKPDVRPDWRKSAPILRGNDRCFYYEIIDDSGIITKRFLYYVAGGQDKSITIPLDFNLKKLDADGVAAANSATWTNTVSTDYGIIIGKLVYGFWVIPWSDIDAYRAKAQPEATPASAPPVTK